MENSNQDRHEKFSARERWLRLCGRMCVGVDYGHPPILCSWMSAGILNRYEERRGSYHDLTHIEHCLDEFEQVGFLIDNPDAVEFALWYHDAIYDPGRNDNEERSAELAVPQARELGSSESFIAKVQALILATKHATIPTDPDEKMMVDIDLAIFGQSETVFDEYESKIRREYSDVSEEVFCRGRANIIQRFLDRPYIFSTLNFRNRYEEQARKNLVRSRNFWQRSQSKIPG